MTAPTINITEPIGLTNVDNAEDATGWDGFRHSGGGTPSPGNETNVFVQGTQGVSIKVSGATRDEGMWYPSVGSVDLTGDGEKHVYVWAAMTDMAQLDGIVAGGFFIIVGSSTSNWNKYYVAGSDTIDGRFVRYVIDVTKTASEVGGSGATLTAVTHIGIGVKAASITGKAENLVCDRVDYGTGLQIEDGDATTPCSWEALFLDDDSDSNKYGIIERRSGDYFLKGGLQIGDGSGTKTSLWLDAGGTSVKFENPLYHNGTALVSAIDAAALYKIDLVGNGTGTTDITFGSVVGSGDDRQGLLGGRIASNGPKFTVDGETDIADLDTVNLYGLTVQGAGIIALSGSTKTDAIGCTFINCDEIQPNDAEFLNNTVIAPVPDRGVELLTTHTAKQVNFVAGSTADQVAARVWNVDVSATPDLIVEYTTEFEDATVNNCIPFPATEAAGDYCAFGYQSKFAKLTIDTGTARSGGSLAWEYADSATTWASFSPTDGTSTLSTTGSQDVTFTPPTDWTATSINGESPLFYVRLNVTGTMTTNPLIDEGRVGDIVEHHTHFPAAGTYTADALKFFGFGADGAPKWMGENSGSSAAITLEGSNGSNITDAETDETGSGTTAVENTRVVSVTTRDAKTGDTVATARTLVRADTGGDLPAGDTVTITHTTTTAEVSHTAHAMPDGTKVQIVGANEIEYRGIYAITVTGPNDYTYTMGSDPGTDATGTILATAVIIDGDSDGSGLIENTSFNFTSDQPIEGYARRSTSSPLYKTALIAGSITDAGFSTNTFMVGDEG